MTNLTDLKLGFIGLGEIGAPMAEQIEAAGYALMVWNRTAAKMQPFKERGVLLAETPARLAKFSDIVFTCLSSESAMEGVLFGKDGIFSQDKKRTTLIVDHSTVSPDYVMGLGARLSKQGVALMDSPVSGGAVGARAGTLATMIGGQPSDLNRIHSILRTYANQITHMGPLGSGQATKACNQIINFGNIAALADALSLAQVYGIAPGMIPTAISGGFADSNIAKEFKRSLEAADFSPIRYLVDGLNSFYRSAPAPHYKGTLGILIKDLTIALDMAHSRGVPLPSLQHFDMVFRFLENQPPKPPINLIGPNQTQTVCSKDMK